MRVRDIDRNVFVVWRLLCVSGNIYLFGVIMRSEKSTGTKYMMKHNFNDYNTIAMASFVLTGIHSSKISDAE